MHGRGPSCTWNPLVSPCPWPSCSYLCACTCISLHNSSCWDFSFIGKIWEERKNVTSEQLFRCKNHRATVQKIKVWSSSPSNTWSVSSVSHSTFHVCDHFLPTPNMVGYASLASVTQPSARGRPLLHVKPSGLSPSLTLAQHTFVLAHASTYNVVVAGLFHWLGKFGKSTKTLLASNCFLAKILEQSSKKECVIHMYMSHAIRLFRFT